MPRAKLRLVSDDGIMVFPVGATVCVAKDQDGQINGVVTQISIGAQHSIRYEVSWFNGDQYVSAWFNGEQVEHVNGELTPRKIGFKP